MSVIVNNPLKNH